MWGASDILPSMCVRRVTLSLYAYKVDGRKEKMYWKIFFYISFLMPRLYLPDNNNRPIGKRRKKKFFSRVFSKEQSTTYNEKIQDFSRVVFALRKIPNKFVTPPVPAFDAFKFGCVF